MERKGKLGLGTAYITGFKWAIAHHYDYIFEMDADFSHNPEDLVRLYEACADGKADMAVGSRYKSGVNVVNWPMGRVLMSYFASKYVQIYNRNENCRYNRRIQMLYQKRYLEAIDLDSIRFKGYAFQIEMKFTAWKSGFTIAEIPIIFTDRKAGSSKMSGGIFNEALWGVLQLKIRSYFKHYNKKAVV